MGQHFAAAAVRCSSGNECQIPGTEGGRSVPSYRTAAAAFPLCMWDERRGSLLLNFFFYYYFSSARWEAWHRIPLCLGVKDSVRVGGQFGGASVAANLLHMEATAFPTRFPPLMMAMNPGSSSIFFASAYSFLSLRGRQGANRHRGRQAAGPSILLSSPPSNLRLVVFNPLRLTRQIQSAN